MQKQTIVIVINDFGRGGAEILLVGILPELNERYNVVLVTLNDTSDFPEDEIMCSHRYVLGLNGRLSAIKGVFKLKQIIRKHTPSFVHAHMVYGSLIARIACPSNIPLLYTIHGKLSNHVFDHSPLLTFLEKITIKKSHSVIAVSSEVMIDYERTIKKIKNQFILDNYIRDEFFLQKFANKKYQHLDKLKLVAVGNINTTDDKNYSYLIKAFLQLKAFPVTLDVYGKPRGGIWEVLQSLQKEADAYQLPIVFKGGIDDIHEVLQHYDVYVMSSKQEGFGIAVVEAMAVGLPLLLSDLPVLHSVTFNNAIFFDVSDPMSFVSRIKEILEDRYDLNKLSVNGTQLAIAHYTKKAYLEKLFAIYDIVM
jgi:glycosyltransferase involved in cell wall biosynthesis